MARDYTALLGFLSIPSLLQMDSPPSDMGHPILCHNLVDHALLRPSPRAVRKAPKEKSPYAKRGIIKQRESGHQKWIGMLLSLLLLQLAMFIILSYRLHAVREILILSLMKNSSSTLSQAQLPGRCRLIWLSIPGILMLSHGCIQLLRNSNSLSFIGLRFVGFLLRELRRRVM